MNAFRRIFSFLSAATITIPLCFPGGAAAQSAPEPFLNGERWCVVGDDVTHHGDYHTMVELFYLTRFPGRTLETINCGLANATVSSTLERLPWDVEARKPTAVSVLLGMNDIGRTLYTSADANAGLRGLRRERIDAFGSGLRSLVARLKSTGARVTLLTPTIYDETVQLATPAQIGANEALTELVRIVRDVAKESGSSFVDLHGAMQSVNNAIQERDGAASIMEMDRIQPAATGHFVMAYAILNAQNASGLVSRLVIDLKNNAILAAENGTAENVRRDRDQVSFRWTEKALPCPVPSAAAAALAFIPFQEKLNRQIVQITGLRAGEYEMLIDGEWVRNYAAEELAAGINLAGEANTPQYRQALEIQRLLQRRAELVADGLRSVVLVEHQLAPGARRPLTLAQMEPLVTDWKEKAGPEMMNTPLGKSVSLYLLRKEREEEASASVNRLLRLAELAAMPRAHDFEIRPVR